MSSRLVTFTLSFWLVITLFLPRISALLGPISADRPFPAGGSISNSQPPNSFFQDHSPPFPTNDWWVGFASGSGTAAVAGPFPFQTRLNHTGVSFGISTKRDFDGVSVHQYSQMDWLASFIEHSGNARDHKALSWDTQAVTVQYFTGSSAMTTYLVPGSPYMTFHYTSAIPRLMSTQGPITEFAGRQLSSGDNVSSTGTKFKVINSSGSYLIYSLMGPITLHATSSGNLTASSKLSGVIRLAKLNNEMHQTLLDDHHTIYPTAVKTDYSFNGDQATLMFEWETVGSGNELLMLTWPHHRINMDMKTDNLTFPPIAHLSYLTTKGYMYPALGSRWLMRYSLPTITWNAPREPDSSCHSSLVAGLEYEIGGLPPVEGPRDFYFWGGTMTSVSRLALIAEVLGRIDLTETVVNYLKQSFIYWFNSSAPTQIAYETAWGGMINKAGAENFWVDFGNGYYNDHHFHYGYFLTVAAVIAKYDENWLDRWRRDINWIMRDIVNPSVDDPYFPVARCRDWFAGHSWASGITNGAAFRDQESVGEAVNGYYGALLWATVSGQTDIANYCRLLLAGEQHAAQVYWHLYPQLSPNDPLNPYPEEGVRDLITMGNVQDWQAGAWLFWGNQKIQIAAIQILPVTPVNEYMYDSQWAENIIQYTAEELRDPAYGDEWKSVIYLAYAGANPRDAARRSSALTGWGSGNSFSNQLYFLSTREGASGLCSADILNPLGRFVLQASNGQFISRSSLPLLVASAASQADAAVFDLGFAPNAGTIRSVDNGQYVTADITGDSTLSAAREVVLAWEIFVIRQLPSSDGYYSILAGSNKNYLVVQPDGSIRNDGAIETSATGFRLIHHE